MRVRQRARDLEGFGRMVLSCLKYQRRRAGVGVDSLGRRRFQILSAGCDIQHKIGPAVETILDHNGGSWVTESPIYRSKWRSKRSWVDWGQFGRGIAYVVAGSRLKIPTSSGFRNDCRSAGQSSFFWAICNFLSSHPSVRPCVSASSESCDSITRDADPDWGQHHIV